MSPSRAAYMEWAKSRPAPKIDLAGSNLAGCSLADLPEAREALDIAGESPSGYAPLVERIAARYGVAPDQVATGGGCSGANFLAMAAILDAGDEALIESPNYDPLPASASLLGATLRTFERRFENGYRIDSDRVAAALTPRTRLLIVSNPHNPSGVLASEEEMKSLARMAERAGVPVLVDEVYLDAVFEDRPPSAAVQSPMFIATSSLTKAYGLASLRCGWALASAETTARIRRVRNVVDVWSPIPADRLSVVAFDNLGHLSDRARSIVVPNLSRVREFLRDHPLLECAPPRATIAFPRFRDGRDSRPFVSRLFQEHGVAVVPGSFFDSPSHFRLSFGGLPENVETGLAAISSCLA